MVQYCCIIIQNTDTHRCNHFVQIMPSFQSTGPSSLDPTLAVELVYLRTFLSALEERLHINKQPHYMLCYYESLMM